MIYSVEVDGSEKKHKKHKKSKKSKKHKKRSRVSSKEAKVSLYGDEITLSNTELIIQYTTPVVLNN